MIFFSENCFSRYKLSNVLITDNEIIGFSKWVEVVAISICLFNLLDNIELGENRPRRILE